VKILILNHNQERFGTYFRCRTFAEGLSEKGHQITMLCASGKKFDLRLKKRKINPNFTIITLPRVKYYSYYTGQIILRLPFYLFYVLKGDYDLLYAFTVAQPQIGIPAMLGKLWRRKKLIIDWDDLWGGGFATAHPSLVEQVLTKSETFFLRFADKITCASQDLYKRAVAACKDESIVNYLPNICRPFGARIIKSETAKKKLGLPPKEKFILSMGNTYASKTLDLLLESFRHLLKKSPEVKLVFLSSLVFPEKRKKRFKDIMDKITLTGFVSEEDKNNYLLAADALILPMENNPIEKARFPIRLGDYLASGRPIVSNATGEVKHYLEKYQAGFTSPPASARKLSETIYKVLKDPRLGQETGLKARQLARTDLSRKTIIKKVDQVISSFKAKKKSKQKLGILILSPFFSPNIGGVETHLNDLTRYLVNQGHQVHVLTYQPLTTKAQGKFWEKKPGLTILRIPWIGHDLFHKFETRPALQFLYLTPTLFLGTLFFLLFNGSKIKAIHAHGFTAALITNILNRFFKGRRLVVSMHAIYKFDKRLILGKICRAILAPFHQIFCLANRSIEDLEAAGVESEKLATYTQWVDQSLFKPRDKKSSRVKIGAKDAFTVLYPPSRLIKKKGAGTLLKAAALLPKKIQFIFVGSGPIEDRIRRTAQKSKNIFFPGRCTQSEAALYYGAADVVVIPSLYEEGFARVVLETLSSGRPPIASKLGCLPEMITAKVGFLVKPTPKIIAEKIKFIYDNPQKLVALTKACRPFALKHYSEKNAQEIEAAYYHV
jgi:glycosyltransferase involved in cell wall biosynthesis